MAVACQYQREVGILRRRPKHRTPVFLPGSERIQESVRCCQSAVTEGSGPQLHCYHETDFQAGAK